MVANRSEANGFGGARHGQKNRKRDESVFFYDGERTVLFEGEIRRARARAAGDCVLLRGEGGGGGKEGHGAEVEGEIESDEGPGGRGRWNGETGVRASSDEAGWGHAGGGGRTGG